MPHLLLHTSRLTRNFKAFPYFVKLGRPYELLHPPHKVCIRPSHYTARSQLLLSLRAFPLILAHCVSTAAFRIAVIPRKIGTNIKEGAISRSRGPTFSRRTAIKLMYFKGAVQIIYLLNPFRLIIYLLNLFQSQDYFLVKFISSRSCSEIM